MLKLFKTPWGWGDVFRGSYCSGVSAGMQLIFWDGVYRNTEFFTFSAEVKTEALPVTDRARSQSECSSDRQLINIKAADLCSPVFVRTV